MTKSADIKETLERIFRPTIIILFSLYSLILIWELFFGGYRVHGIRSYNLVPFNTIMRYIKNYKHYNLDILVINLIGNIVAFVPLGFFIPLLFSKINRLLNVVIITMLLSSLAEIIQFIASVGGLDIDDVILNTLGGLIGFLIYKALNKRFIN